MDGPTDRRINHLIEMQGRSEPNVSPWTFICLKMLISLVFDESVTDGRTDRPGYRDARTHLITITKVKADNGDRGGDDENPHSQVHTRHSCFSGKIIASKIFFILFFFSQTSRSISTKRNEEQLTSDDFDDDADDSR